MKKISFLLICLIGFTACSELNQIAKQVEKNIDEVYGSSLSNSDIISGLKAALEKGTGNSVNSLGKTGGFSNSIYKIAFPTEAQKAADKLRQIGFGKLVDDFEAKLNKAAEQAVPAAKSIFVNAVKGMTINDAKNILMGADNAATNYFKKKTSQQLINAFKPKVSSVLNSSGTTKYWTDITSKYNMLPGVSKVNTDLPQYTCEKIVDALFDKIAKEEKAIRENPSKRSSEILRKVFAAQD